MCVRTCMCVSIHVCAPIHKNSLIEFLEATPPRKHASEHEYRKVSSSSQQQSSVRRISGRNIVPSQATWRAILFAPLVL